MQLQQIDYAPALPNQKRRRAIRRVAVGLAAVLFAILAIKSAPPAWRHVQILYWQHRAMTYSAPAGKVVYDDDPSDVAKLRASDPSLITDAHGDVFDFAKPWDRLYQLLSPPGRLPWATVFLHKVVNVEGDPRLVVVEALSSRNEGGQTSVRSSVRLRFTVFNPGDIFHLPREEPGISGDKLFFGRTKWFAGQIDPTDATHFTIQGVWNGAPVSVDGRLRENDEIQLDAPLAPQTSTSPAPSSSAKSPPTAR